MGRGRLREDASAPVRPSARRSPCQDDGFLDNRGSRRHRWAADPLAAFATAAAPLFEFASDLRLAVVDGVPVEPSPCESADVAGGGGSKWSHRASRVMFLASAT